MPRIRTVKPEFWGDEKLAPMEPIDRLVFLGLVGMADDAGRILDSVKVVDAFVFPYTDHTSGPSLDRLATASRIIRGVTQSGQRVLQIANWSKHQRVDHPNWKSCLPEIVTPQEVAGVPEAFARDSREIRATTYDLRPVPTTDDRSDNGLPLDVLAAGEPYFRSPKTRVARMAEVRMILQGGRGYAVTAAGVAKGLSDMHQSEVEWRPQVLRKWFEGGDRLLRQAEAAGEVRRMLAEPRAVEDRPDWSEDESDT